MLQRILVLLAVTVMLAAAPAARAQEEPALSAKQSDAVRKLVRDYMMEHPEIIAEALEALREKQMLAAEAEAKKALSARRKDLVEDPEAPVAGNPQGDVVVVEFFDYRCPGCKATQDKLMAAAKADGKVKVVFKEFPILGRDSTFAARAALAARPQNKYSEFHDALMGLKGEVTEQAILEAAGKAGLNVEMLKKDMAAPEIAHVIEKNQELADALNINSTPTFVIGDRLVSGPLDQQAFKTLIEQARTPNKG